VSRNTLTRLAPHPPVQRGTCSEQLSSLCQSSLFVLDRGPRSCWIPEGSRPADTDGAAAQPPSPPPGPPPAYGYLKIDVLLFEAQMWQFSRYVAQRPAAAHLALAPPLKAPLAPLCELAAQVVQRLGLAEHTQALALLWGGGGRQQQQQQPSVCV
jgi:hypothetical protein